MAEATVKSYAASAKGTRGDLFMCEFLNMLFFTVEDIMFSRGLQCRRFPRALEWFARESAR